MRRAGKGAHTHTHIPTHIYTGVHAGACTCPAIGPGLLLLRAHAHTLTHALAHARAQVVESAENKRKLKEIEDRILHVLSSSQGNILEDASAIQILSEAKAVSNEITEKEVVASQTQAEIDGARVVYKPCGMFNAVLFFCIRDMVRAPPSPPLSPPSPQRGSSVGCPWSMLTNTVLPSAGLRWFALATPCMSPLAHSGVYWPHLVHSARCLSTPSRTHGTLWAPLVDSKQNTHGTLWAPLVDAALQHHLLGVALHHPCSARGASAGLHTGLRCIPLRLTLDMSKHVRGRAIISHAQPSPIGSLRMKMNANGRMQA